MVNGYTFDMAKEGANEYSVQVNGRNQISGSNFVSALDIYKYIESYIENAGATDLVHLVKNYDSKTKCYVDDIIRSNEEKVEKIRVS